MQQTQITIRNHILIVFRHYVCQQQSRYGKALSNCNKSNVSTNAAYFMTKMELIMTAVP